MAILNKLETASQNGRYFTRRIKFAIQMKYRKGRKMSQESEKDFVRRYERGDATHRHPFYRNNLITTYQDGITTVYEAFLQATSKWGKRSSYFTHIRITNFLFSRESMFRYQRDEEWSGRALQVGYLYGV